MYYQYGRYVTVEEKRARAEKKLNTLKKKNPKIQPVVIEGRNLATTWWGKAWNKNLELYADYANRIGRGRSYVRHRAVLDLQIHPGKVIGLVMGSRSTPYQVSITIQPIAKKRWLEIKEQCKGKLDSIRKLLAGELPKELDLLFTQKGKGLFPSPKEIHLSCSCPDWAVMCKHVAAVLYGIGARLDENPSLFFVLRNVDIQDLISETVKESKKDLLTRAKKKSSRIIDDDNSLSDLFGIELEQENLSLSQTWETSKVPKKRKDTKQPVSRKKTQEHSSGKGKNQTDSKTGQGKTSMKKPRRIKDAAGIETFLKRRTKRHTRVAELIEKADMDPQKVRNILIRLTNQGKLKRVSRGIYQWTR